MIVSFHIVENKDVLGSSGVLAAIVGLLETDYDAVPPLQNAVVGVMKHLTASHGESLHQLFTIDVSSTDSSAILPDSGQRYTLFDSPIPHLN